MPVEPSEPNVEEFVVPVGAPVEPAGDGPDLDHVGRRLAAVEAALERLDAGTYWTDEITGEPIPDQVLEADPVARRVAT
ncbi:hypothetical protein BH23ACT3_BH23ACT3_12400 [soil metagenome]